VFLRGSDFHWVQATSHRQSKRISHDSLTGRAYFNDWKAPLLRLATVARLLTGPATLCR
jgi:hypothetical protein